MSSRANQRMLDSAVADHLNRDFYVVRPSQTVGEAVAALRQQPPGGLYFYIYVLDDDGQLVGVLPTRTLIFSPPDAAIDSLMIRDVVMIPAAATVLEACEFFIQHRFLAMPVVDGEARLVGVVDVGLFTDEVFDLAEQRARDDVFQLIGIHVINNQQIAPWSGFRDRFPWLIANVVGGTVCALLSQRFEGLLAAVIAVAMFVPIVLNLSESVSIQSMSILLQGLHASGVDRQFLWRALAREVAVASLLGLAAGAVVGILAGVWQGSFTLGLTLVASVFLAILCAGLLGLVLPVAVRALRADPRIAAGPITLATTDVVTLLVYFAVATRILM